MINLTSKQKGDAYERYVCTELNLEPDTCAWIWNTIPLKELRKAGIIYSNNEFRLQRKNKDDDEDLNTQADLGCDILVKNKSEYKIAQCKCYNKSSVKLEHLGGFFNLIMQYGLNGILFHTSRLSKHLLNTYNSKFYKSVYKPFYELIEQTANITPLYTNILSNMYGYQIQAYQSINFSNKSRTILQMPCGLGKTVVAMRVGLDYDQVVFIAPLREYCKQNIARFKYELGYLRHETILIDSDGIRDLDKIINFISTHKKIMLSICFKSVDILNKIIGYLTNPIIIIDEFHNLTRDDIITNELAQSEMNKLLCSDAKILFMSATPKTFSFDDIGLETSSKIFGPVSFSYDMGRAITNKYICDYEIFIPKITEAISTIEDISQEIDIHEFDESIVTKVKFLINGCCEVGARKCIVYTQTKSIANQFKQAIQKLDEFYALGIYVDTIVSDDSSRSRTRKIKEFVSSNSLSFLCAVHILDECIDIPTCDSVFLTYPSQSKIKNIQRICRANRIDKTSPHKKSSIFVWADENDDLIELIGHLKEYDESFGFEKISIMDYTTDTNILIDKSDQTDPTNTKLYEELEKFIIGIKKLEKKDNTWELKRQELFVYCNTNGKTPPRKETIGAWYERHKTKIMSKDDHIYLKLSENPIVKAHIDKYMEDSIIKKADPFISLSFDEKVEVLFEFANKFKRPPAQSEGKIGAFLHDQLHKKFVKIGNDHYNKLIKNEYIKKRIDTFFRSKEDKKDIIEQTQEEKKELLFEYISEYGYVPTVAKTDDPNNKYYRIGQWIVDKKKDIESEESFYYKLLSSNSILKEDFDKIINYRKEKNNVGHKEMYENSEKELLEYINKHNQLPEKSTKLYGWLYDRAKKIKSKEDKKYQQYQDYKLITDYFDEFMENHKTNKIRLSKDLSIEQLDKYVKEYKKCPSSSEMYENHPIGRFFTDIKSSEVNSITSPMYIKLSQLDPIIKDNLDKYLADKNKKITFDKGVELCVGFVNKFNKVPSFSDIYEDYPIGKWYAQKKKDVKTFKSKEYIGLSVIPVFKKDLDKIIQKKSSNNVI